MREDRSTKRLMWEVFGSLAIAGVVLLGVLYCFGRAVKSASDVLSIGTPPTHAERQEVERADCKTLIRLEYRYYPNADSSDPEMTLMQLAQDRVAKLHCELPPVLQSGD